MGNGCIYTEVMDFKGITIDFWLSKMRDKGSAKKFFGKALKSVPNPMPRVITTYKFYDTEIVVYKKHYEDLSFATEHVTIKYLIIL